VQIRFKNSTQVIYTLIAITASAYFAAFSFAVDNNDSPKAGDKDARNSVVERFKNASTKETPDFQRHVAPLLGRLGCNGRACHGSFQGQGGFQLSLFGYDFEHDHKALLADGRVDVKTPNDSLVLTKPTDEDNHEGGLRYEKGSWQFNLISTWIKGGAQTPKSLHKLKKLVVEPSELLLVNPEKSVELRAFAHWADGSVEDVTPLCRFHSNDDSIALITEEGFVSTEAIEGDTHVVVSYDSAVVPVPVIHPFKNRNRTGAPKTIKSPTPIDKLVTQKWNKLGLEPSELSDDSMFLRRVSIDITGTLPSPDEIREFIDSSDPDKRSKKIDQLLESPSYAAWWTTFFCDMTENNTRQLRNISYDNNSASNQWYDWIHTRVENNVPYDEMIEGIVVGVSRKKGESYLDYCERMSKARKNGGYEELDSMPYYWMRREFQTRDTRAISFAHAFLGLRIQCAQCHKHPFDQWSQDDFNEFAKFFAGVSSNNYGRVEKEDRADLEKIYKDLGIDRKGKNNGQLRKDLTVAMRQGKTTPYGFLRVHKPKPTREELKEYAEKVKEITKKRKKNKKNGIKTGIPKKPTVSEARMLGGETIDLTKHHDTRVPVMDWMRSPDNPYFAKALVNRVWARYFGVGIVDPADDLNLANPPSNAALLDHLAKEFIKHDFDLKWLHREIANSKTYQLSWVPNETNANDRRNFSRALPRRLPAEVIFDAIASAASNPQANSEYRDSVDGRAISIPGTVTNYGAKRKKGATDSSFALRVFGRSERASSCDCDRSDETSLIQTVYMQNDRDIHTMLTQKNSWLNQLAQKHQAKKVAASDKNQLSAHKKRIDLMKKNMEKLKKNGNEKQARKLQSQIDKAHKKIQPIRKRIAEAESKKARLDIEEVITEAYLRTLSRLPTAEELARCEAHIKGDKDLIKGVTGVMWALVNTKEFIVNH